MIYLASPYSHPDQHTRNWRYQRTLTFTVKAMQAGHTIISPIVYGHHIHKTGVDDFGFERWKELNDRLLSASDEVWVLRLLDWNQSLGVAYEIDQATKMLLPIRFVDMELFT